MVVELSSIEQEDTWQEGGDDFGIHPDVRWFADYTVYLKEADAPVWKRMYQGGRSLNLGHLGIIVCSPAFKDRPEPEYESLVTNALVQNTFNEEALVDHLQQRLTQVHADSQKTLKHELGQFLYIN